MVLSFGPTQLLQLDRGQIVSPRGASAVNMSLSLNTHSSLLVVSVSDRYLVVGASEDEDVTADCDCGVAGPAVEERVDSAVLEPLGALVHLDHTRQVVARVSQILVNRYYCSLGRTTREESRIRLWLDSE